MVDINGILPILTALAAFLIGYLINQGGTCAVAASRELLATRRPVLFAGFALAAGAAGVIVTPLATSMGAAGHLSGGGPLGGPLVLGALLVACGAVANDACLLGSLWRLGNGEIRLLLLPVGLAFGFFAASALGIEPPPRTAKLAMSPAEISTAFAVLAVLAAIVMLRLGGRRRAGRLPLVLSMTLLGVTGGVMFVLQPGWTYADVMRLCIQPSMANIGPGARLVAPALLTIGGAAAAAAQARTFRWSLPGAVDVLRTLVGGALMAFGAAIIPGGNDSLLLAAIPAGSASGALAYGLITLATLALVAAVGRHSVIRNRPPEHRAAAQTS